MQISNKELPYLTPTLEKPDNIVGLGWTSWSLHRVIYLNQKRMLLIISKDQSATGIKILKKNYIARLLGEMTN